MSPLASFVVYLLLGLGVGIALLLRPGPMPAPKPVLVIASLLFWPLLAPILFASQAPPPGRHPSGGGEARLSGASARLTTALAGLEGVADELALPELARVRALASSVAAMEKRVQEMDVLIASPQFDRAAAERSLAELLARGVETADPRAESVRGRLRNIDRLLSLRSRAAGDLERIVLQMEEMSAQLKLMRFAGGASADGDALRSIRQVADSMQAMTDAVLADEVVGEARGVGSTPGVGAPAAT